MYEQKQSVQNTEPQRSVRLERLEYGLPCVSEDGPIIRKTVEHRRLGWSAFFPKEVIPYCEPSAIGVSLDEREDLPRRCPHGTVLRPVLLNQAALAPIHDLSVSAQVFPVLCRVRKRPEDGENGEGRVYTMARYLVSASGEQFSPWEMYMVMESSRMRGMTEAGAKAITALPDSNTLEDGPFQAEPTAAELSQDELARLLRFLQQALIYVISGIPISIGGYVSEAVFFHWVTALWRMLPSALRPYFSCGWGVSAALSGQLTVSYAEQRASVCATFFPGDTQTPLRWDPPSEVRRYERETRQWTTENFDRRYVSAGAHYVWYLYDCEPYELPKIKSLATNSRAEVLVNGQIKKRLLNPPLQKSAASSFQDVITNSLFQEVGKAARNEYLLQRLEQYLDFEEHGAELDFDQLLAEFDSKASKRRILELACCRYEDPERRERAEILLWELLRQNHYSALGKLITHRRGTVGRRLRLMAALQNWNPLQVLKAVSRIVSKGEIFPLLFGAQQELERCLTPGVFGKASTIAYFSDQPESEKYLADVLPQYNERCALIHIQLFQLRRRLLPDYETWLKKYDFALALAMFGVYISQEDRQNILIWIQHTTDSPYLSVLLNWLSGNAPNEQDQNWLRHLRNQEQGEISLRLLTIRLLEDWHASTNSESIAACRQRLLDWLRLAPPAREEITSAVLRLAFGPQLTTGQERNWAADELAIEVARRAVPTVLLPHVAEFAVDKFWDLSPQINHYRQEWLRVLQFWPREAVLALWPINEARTLDAQLNELNGSGQESHPGATVEWKRITQLRVSAEKLEELIRSWNNSESQKKPKIARLHWEWAKLAPNSTPQTPTVQICRYLGQNERPPEAWSPHDVKRARDLVQTAGVWDGLAVPEGFWSGEYHAQRLLLLLNLFPKANFRPDHRQLKVLTAYRQEVNKHLDHPEVVGQRRKDFMILCLPARSRLYPGDQEVKWHKEYLESGLWAVFKEVPIESQRPGALIDALKLYCGDNRMRCADFCISYLTDYTGRNSQRAMEKVLIEFVVGWLHCRDGQSRDGIRNLLFKPEFWRGKDRFADLLKSIRQSPHQVIPKSIERFFDEQSFWETRWGRG